MRQLGRRTGERTGTVGTKAVAKMWDVSIKTAQAAIDRGDIPSWRTPGGHRRVAMGDLEEFRAKAAPRPTSAMGSWLHQHTLRVIGEALSTATEDTRQQRLQCLQRAGDTLKGNLKMIEYMIEFLKRSEVETDAGEVE